MTILHDYEALFFCLCNIPALNSKELKVEVIFFKCAYMNFIFFLLNKDCGTNIIVMSQIMYFIFVLQKRLK